MRILLLLLSSLAMGCQVLEGVPPPPERIASNPSLYTAPFDKSISNEQLLRLANEGSPDAQNELGRRHGSGDGVPKDSQKALHFYELAAARNLPAAQLNLGYMHLMGEGVRKDPSLAARLFYKAAVQGHYAAQYNLGRLFATGEGVRKNGAMAERWWLLSANQGHLESQVALQYLYQNGYDGVDKDSQKAVLWLHRIRDAGRTGITWKHAEP